MGHYSQISFTLRGWLRKRGAEWYHHAAREMSCHQLIAVFAAAVAGILLDAYCFTTWSPWALTIALTVALGAGAVRLALTFSRSSSIVCWITVLAAFAAGGFARHHAHWHWYRGDEIGFLVGDERQTVTIRAVLQSEPRRLAPSEGGSLAMRREPGMYMLLRARALNRDSAWAAASGNVALFTSGDWKPLRAGDIVEVSGRLGPIETQRNPREFDFADHFRGQRRLVTMYATSTDRVQQLGRAWAPVSWLRSTLRSELDRQIADFVDGHRGQLASAILLGNREQLSNDDRDLFLHTGTVHLLAISGLHIGILSGAVYWLLRAGWLSRRTCLISVIVMVLFYAWLVEFRPPVTRAAIWICLFCIARLDGKAGFSYNLLAASGLIVLLFNPHDVFQVGPQFSFLAVAVLIHLTARGWLQSEKDPLARLIYVTRPGHIRFMWSLGRRAKQAFASCAVLWFATLPLVAERYAVVAPIGLLVNPLVLLPMAAALYGGLIVMVAGAWCPPLARVGGWLCQISLGAIEGIIKWGEGLPASHWWTAGPEWWGIATFYLLLVVWISLPASHRYWPVAVIVVIALAIGSWWLPNVRSEAARRASQDLIVTFADVGHGTCAIIQLPGGKILMYDAGSFGSVQRGGRAPSANLWSERIGRIDAFVISHADSDHYNGIPTLMNRFHVGTIYVSFPMLEKASPSVRVLFDEIRRHQIPLGGLIAGDRLNFDDRVAIDVLLPPAGGLIGNDNVNSIVLRLSAYGHTVLLPGDLEGVGLNRLLAEHPSEPCSILMAPHHGSMSSHPDRVARWCRPQVAVLSGARSRINPRCIATYEQSGALVLATGERGAIRLRISPDGIEWQTWLDHGRPYRLRTFSSVRWQPLPAR